MGILARHVAYDGEWPIFFYGLPYLGPIEGYIAAPLFHLFGPSTFTLRLGLLPFFPLFLICMYYLTRLLYTQKLAMFSVLLLCFGSNEIIGRQLKAVGEYPETLFFAAFISFVVFWLVLSSHTVEEQARTTPRRIFMYGILGLVVGVALWIDFLILPCLGTASVLLLLFCRRELMSWAGISLLLGIVIGIFPLLYYNVTAPLDRNSIAILLDIHHAGADRHLPFLQQIVGTLMISLPNATGLNTLCPPILWGAEQSLYCSARRLGAGLSGLMGACDVLYGTRDLAGLERHITTKA
jgi:4-amino-4-deoxy-L-arabinose transferase-like glycosyltransferase